MAEALESDYIPKNPARKATLPRYAPQKETRSLTEAEVRKVFTSTDGRDHLWWQVLLLTGIRISELLALEKTDITADGAARVEKFAIRKGERHQKQENQARPAATVPTRVSDGVGRNIGRRPAVSGPPR